MEKLLIKGDVYTVATKTECTVTSANGTLLGKATAENPVTFTATTDRVELSDPDAEFARVNPKYAPVKLRLLGLLGGGSTNTLPAGYIAAAFLESDGKSAVIDSQIVPDFETGVYVKMHALNTTGGYYYLGTQNTSGAPSIWIFSNREEFSIRYNKSAFNIAALKTTIFEAKINWLNSKIAETALGQHELTQEGEPPWRYHLTFFRATYKSNAQYDNGAQARFYYIKISQGVEIVRDMLPCISPTGEPCMYDKTTKQPFKNAATGSFIVGFTLAQARNLSKLPATGGTLTVSLPWEAQLIASGIPAILQAAAAKGWTITVQYREPEADNAYYNKYAECVTVADMEAVNADYKNDLTTDGEWVYPLPELKNSSGAFARSANLVSFDADLPKLTDGRLMFRNMPKMKKFKGSLKALKNGQEMFCYSPSFTVFDSTLESLTEGVYMFLSCQLDKESALKILHSIPLYTNRTPNLVLGIHVDHKLDEEVLAAIADAEAKGWKLSVGWNGTATAQTASTFGLRKPPIYAKLGTVERPDGTSEQILDWGHYVTNWAENGYQEFASVEAAKEYFNIGD